jgi:hypothetical protein
VDELVTTGLEYLPGDPVLLRIAQHRFPYVRDDGAAVEKAGRPAGWRTVAERVARELVVNVSRGGVVSLPVVPAGPGLDAIVARVGEASLTVYQELLDLDADHRGPSRRDREHKI